ncbi:RNA polymerase sigma-70 factor, ECF subfamily [Fontibacillus panacisegetis]|uniref:RNA polymerase sigma-70 factor, ECF subfamily n=1 Tax=Fontibacillus panacisegetis TaxID=670482 RepID=A0A1G7M0S9_9BACL|nr:sigma-70 family RNA polymerase sigma factor [Fontibacillus panacisegetis]SDF55402.1 RNA polymerase sigma-70 factor, ECF subfamily [Fontibacillus panacisegetis]
MAIVEQGINHLMYKIIQAVMYLRSLLFQFATKEKQHEAGNISYLNAAERKQSINHKVEWLLEEYGNSILRMAYSYLHSITDAEDVLQDTLIQYIKAAPKFENSVHEKAWLLRVAINISKNKITYNKKRGTMELDEGLVAVEEHDLYFVWEAVKSLPSKYSEVLHLFYQEGYSTAQIANIVARKEATVRSFLHRGREKLKVILKEEYHFEE